MKGITSLAVKSLVTILIGSGTLAGTLQAQPDRAMTASIPFTFTVGAQRIPAGTYRFSLESNSFLLSVVNVRSGHEELFPVRPEQQREFERHGHLVFGESEGSSILNEVHFLGTNTFTEVIQRRGAGRIEAKNSSNHNSVSVAQR